MKTNPINYLVLAALLAGCARTTGPITTHRPAEPKPAREIVQTDCALEVNGYSQIERQIFGITAYAGAPFLATAPGAAFIKEYGVESAGMPGQMGWVLPQGVKEMDAAAIAQWFADPKGAAELFFHYRLTDRYVYGTILGPVRSAGAEPWIYLLGNVPGHSNAHGTPTDDALWAQLAAAYVKLCRQADPQLTYLHVWNEPNAQWFKDNKYGKDYLKLFQTAAREIKKAVPDVKIGGPVLCWPPTWPAHQSGQRPWYTWELYTKPLLDGAAAELDFLDWHTYDLPANDLEGELHLVTGYAQSHNEKWLRSAVTETSCDLSKEQWHDRTQHFHRRVLPMIRQTFTWLRNPDKIFCQQVHDLFAVTGATSGWYRFQGDETLPITPMQEFFGVCKPLRGARLVTASPDKEVWVEAAASGIRVTVALANFATEIKQLPVARGGLAADRVGRLQGEVLDVAGRRPAVLPGPDGIIALPPQSLTVLVFNLRAPWQPVHTRERREFFAKEIMVPIPDGQSLKVTVPVGGGAQNRADSAALRFGLKGAGATGQWQVSVAGQKLLLDRPGAFVEVSLPAVPQGYPVEVEFSATGKGEGDQPTFLSFASLVLDTQRAGKEQ